MRAVLVGLVGVLLFGAGVVAGSGLVAQAAGLRADGPPNGWEYQARVLQGPTDCRDCRSGPYAPLGARAIETFVDKINREDVPQGWEISETRPTNGGNVLYVLLRRPRP